MAQQVRNVTNIIINAEDAALSTVAGDGAGPAGLNVGEVGVFSADGRRVVNGGFGAGEINAADVTSFFLARGSANAAGDGYHKTDLVNVADIVAADCSVIGGAGTNAAATEQNDTIGYDGASGSIEAINNNLYLVSLYVQEYLTSSTDGRAIKHFQYKSDASATQAEIAIGLVGSAIHNFQKEAEQYIAFKAMCDVALASDFVFDATFEMTATNGSNTLLSAAASPTYNTGTAIAVGDYIRLGTAAGIVGAVALASDMYRVTALPSTTTIQLDRKVQVATGQYTIASGGCTVVTAALGNAANWGLDLLGQPLSFVLGKEFYKKARWEMSLKDFGTSSSARAASATRGDVDGHQIAETEWFMAGFEGENYRMGEPTIYPLNATADATLHYGTYSISFRDNSLTSFSNNVSPKLILVAIPTNAGVPSANTPANAVSLTADSVTQVLDELLGSGTSLFI